MKAKEKKSKGSAPTRERILDSALKLFNEKGEGPVTTAQIAEHLNISEGNLWYHFRTKRDIIFELFCRLEAEVDKNLSRLPEENFNLRDFMSYAARAFEYLWEYRFLFRDRYDRGKNEDAVNRLQELTARGQKYVERILDDMRRREMLFLSPDEAQALTVNAWIIHSNWLRFLQIRENVQEIRESHIKEGFTQIIWLFNPYLSEAGKLEAAIFINEFSLKQFNSELREKD
ncbi:MAG TPA: TetR/AcrR family transcriptional regulator [Pyrinomonadaceae bacterium]|jgi:AcrR family transcriptional regulator